MDEFAGIGVAGMDRELVAMLDGTNDLVDVADLKVGIDALAEQIQRQGHDIDVAGTLTIAEERAFDAIGSGHNREFGGGDRSSAVVVRVQAQSDAVAVADIAAEPFDLI